MRKKLNIGLIFGGKSGEHEVSLISARSIFGALDKKKYNVELIGIDKEGNWRLGQPKDFWINPESPKTVKLDLKYPVIVPASKKGKVKLIDLKNGKELAGVDVFFPITHGTFGEDGCLQGMFEMLGAAYVGPGVLGSAVGMDKDVMKRLFLQAGIPTARFCTCLRPELSVEKINKIINDLKFPIFVKPANLGSSVGISKVENISELKKAIKDAFQYDTKIILEEMIRGREIECSVMGNERSVASVPGEIKLQPGSFYSYEAKYVSENIATPTPAADLSKKEIEKIKELAKKVFQVLNCEGMGRVDFFLTPGGKIYANEINTLPGFTSVSMFPKMFEKSGIKYADLLDKLIQFAIKRQKRNSALRRNFV